VNSVAVTERFRDRPPKLYGTENLSVGEVLHLALLRRRGLRAVAGFV
jgi:hypothetical protein